jgi:thiamine biosynthesis protein ThiS
MTDEIMTIFVNGEEKRLPLGATVLELLRLEALLEKRVAVEVNRQLAVKSAWNSIRLQPLDRVEIVTFVGGG